MILISREEKEVVLEKYPGAHIVRTCRQKSKRHRYYMVEDPGPMRVIKQLRGEFVDKPRNQRKRRR